MARTGVRVRRDAAEWGGILERFERSGLSRLAFCRREGIARGSLEKWTRKLGSGSDGGFVELTSGRGKPEGWAVEVELPNGMVLRLRG